MNPKPCRSRVGLVCVWFLAAAIGCIIGAAALKEAATPMTCVGQPDRLTFLQGDRPVMVYRHQGVPFKPYVSELRTPAGINILRDAPADHLHHHSLMFALRVNGIDFWAEGDRQVNGSQFHQGELETLPTGFVDAAIRWTTAQGHPIARETRSLHVVCDGDPPTTRLIWRSTLTPAEGQERLTLTGNHYFGLGMRFIEAMDEGGRFITDNGEVAEEGQVVRGSERLVRGKWCAYIAGAGDHIVTVAMFDHPSNPRPVRWFTMNAPFAYLSATLNLHEQPMIVENSQPLTVTYSVILWDGEQTAQTIEAAYQQWLNK